MRVILADDQAKVRSALRLMLEEQSDVKIIGEAVDATGVLDRVRATSPDLVLLDWELPGMHDGLVAILHELCPHLKLIALSGRPQAGRAALSAGADAFVSKGDPPEGLLAAIDGCLGGSCSRL
jgi:DNA-binding NarL/FixJ family response regulator